MAHEIDMTTGRASAAFARTPAWHRLGKVLPGSMTTIEALEYAGLNWLVECRPLYRCQNDGTMVPVDNDRCVVRTDTDAVLGLVGSQFMPCQNHHLSGFLDAVIGQGARIESAGALHGGRKIWFLCALKESYDIVPGDQVKPYALFVNGHDGTTRLRVLPTTVRVVCANTLSLATDRERLGMTMRHDGKLDDNIRRAQEALGLVYTAVQHHEIQARELASRQLRADQRVQYLAECVRRLELNEERERLVISQVVDLLDSSTNTLPGIRGTAWSAYNAFSEWIDHSPRKTGSDVRLESNWMGEGHKLKSAAWQLALAS